MGQRRLFPFAFFLAGALIFSGSAHQTTAAWAEDEQPYCDLGENTPQPGERPGTLFAVTLPGTGNDIGTIGWAIEQANVNPGLDTIEIQSGLAIPITEKLEIFDSVVLRASEAENGERASLVYGATAGELSAERDPGYTMSLVVIEGIDFEYVGEEPGGNEAFGFLAADGVCTLRITDSSFTGFPGAGVMFLVEPNYGADVLVKNTFFGGNSSHGYGYNQGAFNIEGYGTPGWYLFEDSVFEDNASGGITIDWEFQPRATGGGGGGLTFGGVPFVETGSHQTSSFQTAEP